MASIEQPTIEIDLAKLSGYKLNADKDGTPVLTCTFEARGRNITEHIDMNDIAVMVGKPITLKIIDHQSRIKED